jgi:arsenate reductase
MSVYTLYHNPCCSKSRQTKQLLEDNGITPEVVLYLEDSPSADTLRDLLAKLGISPRQLLRKGEAEYKERGLADDSLSDEALIRRWLKRRN